MKSSFLPTSKLGAFLLLFVWSDFLFAQKLVFYRYKDTQGITVISTRIPSDFVAKGYDIVTSDGRLIKRIAPEPSQKEKQRILAEEAERKRLKRIDQALLRRYSSLADIESDRNRRLSQIDTDIKLRQSSIDKLDDEVRLWQSKAADEERRGNEVSPETLSKLDSLQREKDVVFSLIASKKKERQEVIDKYQTDMERFNIIRPNTPSLR